MAPNDGVRLISWNVQGGRWLDVAAVTEVIAAERPDVVVLQEVGRNQLDRLAEATGLTTKRWVFKHLTLVGPCEGLGLLTRFELADSRSVVLRPSLLLRWTRRVALIASLDDGAGRRFGIVGTHLSAHEEPSWRRDEVDRLAAAVGGEASPPVIAGDLNDLPGGAAPARLVEHGWTDAWTLDDDGPTNWTPGPRQGRPPTQRLDYIFVPAGWEVRDVRVAAAADRVDWFGEISDHLPLCADLVPPERR